MNPDEQDNDAGRAGAYSGPIGRRRALAGLGALGLAAIAAACRKSSDTPEAGASPTKAGSSPGAGGGGGHPACILTPELTEGPYYLDLDLVRTDITEGKDGAPLKLAVTVVDAEDCTPVKDAAVDLWHCDATGEYSGFGSASGGGPGVPGGPGGNNAPSNDKRFLRGTQVTDASGVATFRTIYPGWYQGRTVHIHIKVHDGGREVHTGQLFFDDAFTDAVYVESPYSSRPNRDVRNSRDNIFGQAAGAGLLDVRAAGEGYEASITLGVKRA